MTRDIVWYIIALILVVQVISLFVLVSIMNTLKHTETKQTKLKIDNPTFKDLR